MEGHSTSLVALTLFIVACASQSWIVYDPYEFYKADGKSVGGLYEVWASPFAVCATIFDATTPPQVYYPGKGAYCGLIFNTTGVFQLGKDTPNMFFPFGGNSITTAEAEKLQTCLGCLVIATFAALVACSAHYEWIMRKLRGYRYRTSAAVVVASSEAFAAMPLLPDSRSSVVAHALSVPGPGQDPPQTHVSHLVMPWRLVWTVVVANLVAGMFGGLGSAVLVLPRVPVHSHSRCIPRLFALCD